MRILRFVPRHVALIGNLYDPEWSKALSALDTQYLTISVYRNRDGKIAHQMEGQLTAVKESLGFARYSEIDKCLRISRRSGLTVGQLQLVDQFGVPSMWTVREHAGALWVSKNNGSALLAHDSYVQVIRTADGRVSLRASTI